MTSLTIKMNGAIIHLIPNVTKVQHGMMDGHIKTVTYYKDSNLVAGVVFLEPGIEVEEREEV